MEKKPMPYAHLHQLFTEELQDCLSAEEQLLGSLKKFAAKALNIELKSALERYHAQSQTQQRRLLEVFSQLELPAEARNNKTIDGLLKQAEVLIKKLEKEPSLDAAIIMMTQKAAHVQIASYGCLACFAKLMQHSSAEQLLSKTLLEKKDIDRRLSEIAMLEVNRASN